jgi:hypothetical protein
MRLLNGLCHEIFYLWFYRQGTVFDPGSDAAPKAISNWSLTLLMCSNSMSMQHCGRLRYADILFKPECI